MLTSMRQVLTATAFRVRWLLALIVTLVFFAESLSAFASFRDLDTAYVLASVANLRAEPDKEAKIIAKLEIATELQVQDTKYELYGPDWVKVVVRSGSSRGAVGWLVEEFLDRDRPTKEWLLLQFQSATTDELRFMWAERLAVLDRNSAHYLADLYEKKRRHGETLAGAIENNDLARVQTLIQAGASINADITNARPPSEDKGVTPLLAALFKGSLDVAKYLIDQGANVNARASLIMGELTATPLSVASEAGFPDIVKLLLEKGADRDYCVTHPGGPKGNGTPLILALRAGHLEIAQMLVAAGADVNAPGCAYGGDGTPAIHFAVRDPQVTALLLSKGADPNSRVDYGMTPLMSAVARGKPESVKLLLKAGADVNATRRDGRTALMQVLFMERDIAPRIDETCFDALTVC